jgi:hypothetical protein
VAADLNEDVKVSLTDDNYQEWTWKQIKNAVCGGWGGNESSQPQVSVPQTVTDAGPRYDTLADTLAKFMRDTRKMSDALVGPNGTWTGLGAKAFEGTVVNIVGAADVLHQALTTAPSYVTTLADAGVDLYTGITEINYADHWGADATVKRYYATYSSNRVFRPPPPWTTAPDGTVIVAVSTYPDIVQTMTDMMRKAIRKLATAYQNRVAMLMEPEEPDVLPPGTDKPDTPTLKMPTIKPPVVNVPKIPQPKPGAPPKAPELNTPSLDNPGLDAPVLDSPGLNPPGLDNAALDSLTSAGLPPGGPPTLPDVNGLTDPKLPGLTPRGDLKLPSLPSLDPTTHLAGLHSPSLSPFADGLHLPGPGDPRNAFGNLPSDSPGGLSSNTGLSPFGISPPTGSAAGLPGRFANLRAGGGNGAGDLAAGERSLAERGTSPMGPTGMPYAPGGARGGKEERERNTWLQEDEDVWGTNPDVAPTFLDGTLEQA